jgi:hypothetical protein
MPRQKIPSAQRTRSAAKGARDWGVLSFGYFSLHEQRKVTRSERAKAVALAVAVASTNKPKHHWESSSGLKSLPQTHKTLDHSRH